MLSKVSGRGANVEYLGDFRATEADKRLSIV